MRVKKFVKLINNERNDRRIASTKGCTGQSYDRCSSGEDYATCTVNSYDVCVKDYAGCFDNSYDFCSYKDTDACGNFGHDYN